MKSISYLKVSTLYQLQEEITQQKCYKTYFYLIEESDWNTILQMN